MPSPSAAITVELAPRKILPLPFPLPKPPRAPTSSSPSPLPARIKRPAAPAAAPAAPPRPRMAGYPKAHPSGSHNRVYIRPRKDVPPAPPTPSPLPPTPSRPTPSPPSKPRESTVSETGSLFGINREVPYIYIRPSEGEPRFNLLAIGGGGDTAGPAKLYEALSAGIPALRFSLLCLQPTHAHVEDATSAMLWLSGKNPGPFVLLGFGEGAAAAIQLSLFFSYLPSRVPALILLSPVLPEGEGLDHGLERIAAEVLIVQGEQDLPERVEASRALSAMGGPRGQRYLRLLPKAGHSLEEQGQELLDLCSAFILYLSDKVIPKG